MAKSKKSAPKAVKKSKKPKAAVKSKKSVAAKTKKKAVSGKAKSAPKKAKVKKASKAKAAPKPTPKAIKAAPKAPVKKVAPKKAVSKKATGSGKATHPAAMASQQAPNAAKIAAAAQLNFFQMPNQRPMAHKPAKPSSTSQDKTRYNDEELKEFQVLINRKLEKAKEEYKILKETLNRNNDEGTDATSGGNTKVLEDGAETAEKENLSQLAARQQKYITNLENALVRIKNGTYGICSVTGKLISKERLIAVPHTTQSIEAKLMQQD
jgi:RNA polymerase-binding transcription factor DksA